MRKYFTINDTKIIFEKEFVKKTYILKTIPKKEVEKVSKFIYSYYKALNRAGVSMPKLISRQGLTFKYEFCGESLIEILKGKKLSKSFMENIVNQIEIILKNCKKNNLGLDPHIKNFTLSKEKVFYVDTFPPVSKQYIDLLTNYNLHISQEIRSHLKTWTPEKLRYHFLADVKKTKDLNKDFYKVAKESFVKSGSIRNFKLQKVNEIIKIEESNISLEGFTLS